MSSSIVNSNKSIYFIKPLQNGFESIKILYEMLQTKMFSYDVSSIKTLLRTKSSNLIMSSK